MNDVQMNMMGLERHQRILAREREKQAAATQPPATNFAAHVVPITPAAAAAPAAAPAMAEAATPAAPPAVRATAPAPMPQLSTDQAALLAASMGASLPETPPAAPAAPPSAAPDLSDDQIAALMAGFGKAGPAPAMDVAPQPEALPQTAAAMAATAIPQAQQENLRYFPLNTEAANARQQMTASDTYLRAVQQMERNLGAYGGLTRHGR